MEENIITGSTILEIAMGRDISKSVIEIAYRESAEFQKELMKYAKKLASFAHAPVTNKEYKRMEIFVTNKHLVQVVFEIIEKYKIPNENCIMSGFDIIGYFYSIALISFTAKERKEYLYFLEKLSDELIEENNTYIDILYRNMDKLKGLTYLEPLRLKIQPYVKS